MKLLIPSAPPPSSAAANKIRLSMSSSSLLRRGAGVTVLLVVASSLLLLDKVQANFGDTVDPTFNCPAFTTCEQVCVATVEDCPPEMACPDNNTTLCADGSCAQECNDPELASPCAYACAPIACNRIDNYFDACTTKYGPLYDAETTCGEQEQISETTLLQYTELAYVYGYAWVSIITVLILGWCAYK
jgi:hypothetical protein